MKSKTSTLHKQQKKELTVTNSQTNITHRDINEKLKRILRSKPIPQLKTKTRYKTKKQKLNNLKNTEKIKCFASRMHKKI